MISIPSSPNHNPPPTLGVVGTRPTSRRTPFLTRQILCMVLLLILKSSNKAFTGTNAFAFGWKPKYEHHSSLASSSTVRSRPRTRPSPVNVPTIYSPIMHITGSSAVSLRAGATSDENVGTTGDEYAHDNDCQVSNVTFLKIPSVGRTLFHKVIDFTDQNFFLVGMVLAVLLAKLVPTLGQNGGILRPELFIGNYGVTMIFFLSGLALQTSELTQAIADVKLNGLVQLFIFAIWPFGIGLPLRYLMRTVVPNNLWISPPLMDGLLIVTTLPTTVNMCTMLTSAGGGNVASAICNAVLSDMAGIVLTPLLVMHMFGATSIPLPFGRMVWKLCQKVLLPVTAGQLLRRTPVQGWYEKHLKTLKRAQEVVLLGIVWNAFCNTFTDGLGLALKDSLILLILLSTLHLLVLGSCFRFFSIPQLKIGRPEQVAASFCASQKTLAFGLPLINTIFQGNVHLAAYCAPLMFLHPLQMALGSLLLPTIERYTSGHRSNNSTTAP
jgi:sodium/bile acid cotransporter 7